MNFSLLNNIPCFPVFSSVMPTLPEASLKWWRQSCLDAVVVLHLLVELPQCEAESQSECHWCLARPLVQAIPGNDGLTSTLRFCTRRWLNLCTSSPQVCEDRSQHWAPSSGSFHCFRSSGRSESFLDVAGDEDIVRFFRHRRVKLPRNFWRAAPVADSALEE